MAASGIVSTNPIVPLNGKNYPTWKLQCQMALMKDNLWRIVTGAELEPEAGNDRAKFEARRDKALAVVVLAVEPSLLYLVGEPQNPKDVWDLLRNHFQKTDLGKQTESEAQTFHVEIKRKRVSAGACETDDGNLHGIICGW